MHQTKTKSVSQQRLLLKNHFCSIIITLFIFRFTLFIYASSLFRLLLLYSEYFFFIFACFPSFLFSYSVIHTHLSLFLLHVEQKFHGEQTLCASSQCSLFFLVPGFFFISLFPPSIPFDCILTNTAHIHTPKKTTCFSVSYIHTALMHCCRKQQTHFTFSSNYKRTVSNINVRFLLHLFFFGKVNLKEKRREREVIEMIPRRCTCNGKNHSQKHFFFSINNFCFVIFKSTHTYTLGVLL